MTAKPIPKEIADTLVFRCERHYPGIKHINCDRRRCEDCNNMVIDRRVEHVRVDEPVLHWEHHCTACDLYQHPETKEFTVARSKKRFVFRDFFKNHDK